MRDRPGLVTLTLCAAGVEAPLSKSKLMEWMSLRLFAVRSTESEASEESMTTKARNAAVMNEREFRSCSGWGKPQAMWFTTKQRDAFHTNSEWMRQNCTKWTIICQLRQSYNNDPKNEYLKQLDERTSTPPVLFSSKPNIQTTRTDMKGLVSAHRSRTATPSKSLPHHTISCFHSNVRVIATKSPSSCPYQLFNMRCNGHGANTLHTFSVLALLGR